MQLALVLMILMVVLISQGDSTGTVVTGPSLWLAFAGCLSLAPLTAACGSWWIARGIARDFPDYRPWLRRFDRLQGVVIAAWLGATSLAMVGCHWPQIVRGNWGLDRYPLVDDLLILAPSIFALLAVWAMYWRVDRSLRHEAESGRPAGGCGEYVLLHARQHLGLPLAPVLLVILLQDLAPYASPWLGRRAPEIAGLASLPLMVLLLPWLLRFVWKTQPLHAGPLRERLEDVCRECGCRLREILVWDTGGRMANAAVAGFLPRMKYLLLTDALLQMLDDDELAAVMRHELAHVRRRHLLSRVLVLALPVWLGLTFRFACPGLFEQSTDFLVRIGVSASWQNMVLWPALAAAYAIVVIGCYSRLLEFDADLGVLDHAAGSETTERIAAIQPFIAALVRITGNIHRRSWLHPSVVERANFLRRCAGHPDLAIAYRGRLDRLLWVVGALYVAAAAVWLF